MAAWLMSGSSNGLAMMLPWRKPCWTWSDDGSRVAGKRMGRCSRVVRGTGHPLPEAQGPPGGGSDLGAFRQPVPRAGGEAATVVGAAGQGEGAARGESAWVGRHI